MVRQARPLSRRRPSVAPLRRRAVVQSASSCYRSSDDIPSPLLGYEEKASPVDDRGAMRGRIRVL
ncbi:hypothetical protein NEOLEDRAFT_1141781 [Neolentinus lepideus HHB14362 ss-1]|uniref:Uncharacterized protein n=1 Tax=Neolentinus lepideus HHB14362 ss-1 TaxID=1314782 RepID=A0A165NHI3_9AGAM|nr:hypothetical protein NEOLEDRAFT_1141781 [Neolentinus lepideus HHB14362 ss-1]